MRHRHHHHLLGVKKEHRAALLANLAAALLMHGRIQTTQAKAKALRPFVERVVTLAKKAQKATPERALYLRRLAISRVRDKKAVHTLFEKKVAEFSDRSGGYARIYKMGPRLGDSAAMALIELIDATDEGHKSTKRGKGHKKKTVEPKTESNLPESKTTLAANTEEKANEIPEAVTREKNDSPEKG